MSVRVRMAPSPTGLLHIGGVHTFLFNWLFARGRVGECLLRIENTDTSREVVEATEQIQRSLLWLGIDWDGPVTFQLDVMDRCRELAQRLVEEGKAYEDEGAIRFRMPDEGVTGGTTRSAAASSSPTTQLEDVVIVRSDGRPTYNFASPVEDMDDAITHVIRGDDHISNTPKQIQILRALGHEPPVYAHVASILGTDGKKLSKRHGAVSVDEFREAGYLPAALVNFLALIGWAPDGETTIMSRDEIVERFTLEAVSASPGTFDYAKLDWMNGVYIRALEREAFADRRRDISPRAGARLAGGQGARDGAGNPGEGRQARGDPRLRRIPVPRRRARSGAARRRILGAAENALRAVDSLDCRRDRGRAQEALRRARREAAHRVRADSRRGDRVEGLARPLREPGARSAATSHSQDCGAARSSRHDGARASTHSRSGSRPTGSNASEEARAVRVGEKETSEQAAIVARYADLFTREQLARAERRRERRRRATEQESIARLRLTCQEGIVDRELAAREDELENALLAARVAWDGDDLSLRSAQARLAIEAEYGAP